MEKEFVPHQPSLDLEELGFDEECLGYHLCKNSALGVYLEITTECIDLLPYDSSSCKAPTFSQAFRWFRDKHELDSEIYMNHEYGIKIYTYLVLKLEKSIISHKSGYAVKQNIYEEAELACLRKLIEIVKIK